MTSSSLFPPSYPRDTEPTTSVLRKTYDTEIAPPPPSQSYPSVASIPRTPRDRLARAHPDLHNHPGDRATVLPSHHHHAASSPGGYDDDDDDDDGGPIDTAPDAGESTVLYLAYGSNLCAKTFLGVRGIRPLSQVNVTAPSLTLTFDLPGLPYREPCFANTAPRVLHKPGKRNDHAANGRNGIPGGLPDVPDVPGIPKLPPALIGVVYEVTPADYAKIVATEGGGSSYRQIVVPCLPLPPSVTVPEKPVVPDPPKPFLARTLCQPRIPDVPDGGDGDRKDNSNTYAYTLYDPHPPSSSCCSSPSSSSSSSRGNKSKNPLLKFLLPIQRPYPYAQPSHRYLSLLRTGAIEHDLPPEYQDYLNNLKAYTITSFRQRLGRLFLSALWMPFFFFVFGAGKFFSDKQTGRSPRWLVVFMTVMFNAVWTSYDVFFKHIFGDGERTESRDEDKGEDGDEVDADGEDGNQAFRAPRRRKRRRSSVARTLRKLSGTTKIVDEEKRALLSFGSDSD